MPDDFVFDVRQIVQFTAATSAAPGDALLMQRGGLGGPYMYVDPTVLMGTALATGGWIQLAPGPAGGIAFNGAGISFADGAFVFSEGLNVPSLNSAGDIFVNGVAVVTQTWVSEVFDSLLENSVWTFNGRKGNVQLQVEDVMRAGAAPIWSPHFGGHVTAPTSWNLQGNDDTVATLAWVQEWARCSGNVVHSFNGRGGDVILNVDDITAAGTVPGVYAEVNTAPSGDTSKRIANTAFVDDAIAWVMEWSQGQFTTFGQVFGLHYAPIDSPQFTGIPSAPTANPGTNTGQLATTAYVMAAVAASVAGVSTWNGQTGDVILSSQDVADVGGALLNSPVFVGSPQGPTAAPGTANAQLATTAFVETAITNMAIGVQSFNTRTGAVVLQTSDVTAVGGALLSSPAFSGTPTAPTPPGTSNNTSIATTAWVTTALSNVTAGVSSWNGRTGAVTLQGSDISASGGALVASPAFTGNPTAPTQTPGMNNQTLATTAFVQAAVAASTAGVVSFNGRTGAVVFGSGDISAAGGALLAGPTFTGIPSAPTAAPNTNTTQLATTAFVAAAIAQAPGGVSSFNTRTGAITLQGSDVSAAGGALLAGPAFTGNPTAPTQVPGTSNTSLATTAFVMNAMATAGGVISFNGRAGTVTLNAADIAGASGALMTVATNPPTGAPATPNQAFWWDNVGGQLYLNYNDGNSTQWVPAAAPAQGQVKATSGNWVKLGDVTMTAANANQYVMFYQNIGDGSYDEYEFVALHVGLSAAGTLQVMISQDGVTPLATGYNYAWVHSNSNNSTSFAGGAGVGGCNIGPGMSAEATTVGDVFVRFSFPQDSNRKVWKWQAAFYNSGSGVFSTDGAGMQSVNPILGFGIRTSAGTINSGAFRIYGRVR